MVSFYFVNQLLADKNVSLSCYREYVRGERSVKSLAMYLQRKGKTFAERDACIISYGTVAIGSETC